MPPKGLRLAPDEASLLAAADQNNAASAPQRLGSSCSLPSTVLLRERKFPDTETEPLPAPQAAGVSGQQVPQTEALGLWRLAEVQLERDTAEEVSRAAQLAGALEVLCCARVCQEQRLEAKEAAYTSD